MIIGIGVDILKIEKINSLWKNHHERFQGMILTKRELRRLINKNIDASISGPHLTVSQVKFLATRIAAKEATSKALGLGWVSKHKFGDIEVLGEQRLTIRLTKSLDLLARSKRITRLIGNCSSTKQVAIALVIGVQ